MLNRYVVLHGSTARAETCASVALRFEHQGRPHEIIGRSRYLDDLEERAGVWRILRRQLVLDHARVVEALDRAADVRARGVGLRVVVRVGGG